MTIGSPDARTKDPDRTGSLLEKTAGGAGWTIGWRATTRALGFLSTLVLARILVPADFGLVALAMSFSRAIDTFADLGVQEALVRASHSSRATYDTAFTINAIRFGHSWKRIRRIDRKSAHLPLRLCGPAKSSGQYSRTEQADRKAPP